MIYKSVLVAMATMAAMERSDAFVPTNGRRMVVSKDITTSKVVAMPSSKLLRMAVTDAPTKMDVSPMGGMFTNSSPETRRVIPANLQGKTKFKIVYVVLESQYQSALSSSLSLL